MPSSSTFDNTRSTITDTQHLRDKSWQLNEKVDTDLTDEEILNNEQLHKQRTKALNIALRDCNVNVNNYLEEIQGKMPDEKRVSIMPWNFKGTLYDRVLISDSGKVEVGYFPVEMEARVEDCIPRTQKKVKLTVQINIDNPRISRVQHGPQVPHVGYKISGSKSAKFKKCGHILLNEGKNECLPHRRSDNIKVDSTKTENNNMLHRIPINRLFHGPTNDKLVLERTDKKYSENLDQSEIRGKSFISASY